MKNNSDATPESDAPKKKSVQKQSRTSRLLTRFFNFRAWSDWDRSKAVTQYFLGVFERVLMPKLPRKSKKNSFESVVSKLKLSEKELQARAHGLRRLSYILAAMAVFFLGYLIYLSIYGSLKALLITSIELMIVLVLSFRYHFWYFQIEQRRLGCSVKEWCHALFTKGG